jgi:hypothetical protein
MEVTIPRANSIKGGVTLVGDNRFGRAETAGASYRRGLGMTVREESALFAVRANCRSLATARDDAQG